MEATATTDTAIPSEAPIGVPEGAKVETTRIAGFPAARLAAARTELDKAYRRAVRAAVRVGQVVTPAAPELAVVREYIESRCTECGCIVAGFAGGRCPACRRGYYISREVVDLELRAETPRVAGWEFVAVVEPMDGGNLIRQVPGASVADGELCAWRTGAIACDHCGTTRRRTETFILRGASSLAPRYKQVGRNCLADFLGGVSPAAIIASIGWPSIVRGAGEDGEGGWGEGACRVVDPLALLEWAAAAIRIDGWTSRSAARESAGAKQATATTALFLAQPPGGGDRSRWLAQRERYAPTSEDRERAAAALAWARELGAGAAALSDYERNLTLVARQAALKLEHAGILASAITAHTRVLGREVEQRMRAARDAVSHHVGEVGRRAEFELVLERVLELANEWGPLRIFVMRDKEGNILIWKTGAAIAQPGERLRLRGTIKAHSEYRGAAQTELTRCKVLDLAAGGAELPTVQATLPLE